MDYFTRPIDILRVMTLNTWFRPPLEDRMREMATWIDVVNPHIVCLQEVRKRADEATLENGALRMEVAPMKMVYSLETL